MSLQQIKDVLEKSIRDEIPKFEIIPKPESKFMKFLSVLLFFNRKFMSSFWTTIYPKVYPPKALPENPSENEIANYLVILAHEGQHLFDRKALWWIFNLVYLSPQIFALLAFLSFVNLWWLLALLFLAPIPSIGRAVLEIRGYNVSVATTYWIGCGRANIERIVDNFCNGNYYFMFPFRSWLIKMFEKTYQMVKEDQPLPKYLSRFRLLFRS